jgi:hypothetical protein
MTSVILSDPCSTAWVHDKHAFLITTPGAAMILTCPGWRS